MKRIISVSSILVGLMIFPIKIFSLPLSVYLTPDTEKLLGSNVETLRNKMDAVISAAGAFSSSDSRYAIVPKVNIIEETSTSSIPVQDVVKIEITYCVGDAIDGKLYNTLDKTYKGIGESRSDAIKSAILKINPSSSDLKQLLTTTNDRIISFYNETGEQILQKARKFASSENYEDALVCLEQIPANCKYYEMAQDFAQEYIEKIVTRNNRYWLNKAKSTWSSSQNISGATEAKKYLDHIIVRNNSEQNGVNSLISEINNRINEYHKNQFELKLRQIESDAAISIAKTKARADIVSSLANAAASIIPNIIRW